MQKAGIKTAANSLSKRQNVSMLRIVAEESKTVFVPAFPGTCPGGRGAGSGGAVCNVTKYTYIKGDSYLYQEIPENKEGHPLL